MMKDSLRYSLDPVSWCSEVLGITPDPWQSDVLRSSSKRVILNCCRQAGKSTIAAAIALHMAVYRPGSLILLVSPSLRQSNELFRKVSEHMRKVKPRPSLDEDNKLSCTFTNGSRIVSLPGSEETIRGYSGVSLVIEDEASRVDDALYRSVRPMLAVSDGRLILMSTPRGKRGHFFEEWIGSGVWDRVEITAPMVSRISPDFLEEERQALGEWWYQQEYQCSFSDTTDSLFRYDDIQACLCDDIEPLFPVTLTYTVSPLSDTIPLIEEGSEAL